MSNNFFQNVFGEAASNEVTRRKIESGTSTMGINAAKAAATSKDFFQNVFGGAADTFVSNEKTKNVTEEKTEISSEDLDKYKRYTASKYFEYPSSVGMSEQQPHSVRFYINVRENSRVAALSNSQAKANTNAALAFYGGGKDVGQAGDENNLKPNPDRAGEGRLNADQLESLSKGSGMLAAGLLTAGLAGNLGKNPTSFIGDAAAFLSGGALAAIALAATDAFKGQQTLRTLGAIDLHVAAPPVAQYSANWENKELGALAGIPGAFNNFNLGEFIAGSSGAGALVGRGVIKAAANLPSALGIAGELGASIDLATGRVANPYKEQLFSNMGFRQFAFNYKFNPKNSSEYAQVQEIIQLFKYHMHPENAPGGLFLEYPSEFNIEYHYKGSENPHVSKISTCALTDIKITYGNQDSFTTIQGTNGAPAEINMQLAFTELEVLTNKRIAEGF
jgi:hypothetical protein